MPERIHASAVIHQDAHVAETAVVGAGAVVQRGARIGEHCVVLAGATIEERAVVGAGTVLQQSAVIGYACEIGRDAIIGAGAIIGSEGFGFAQDGQRKSHRIPHLGNVVVGDRVVIGANCCIDRATHRSTRIGSGTIMDNLCHIAHNVQIGENCRLSTRFVVAGSTTIGDRFVAAELSAVLGHLTITDDVSLEGRAGVHSDITVPGVYGGQPLQPLGEMEQTHESLRRLVRLREAVTSLDQRIASLEGEAR